ncbi:hypothetical protein P5706_35880 [Pseudomonas sp. ChxA]|jgi:hypothetical protein|nr:hypothetical protein [Pseudomonas sp. ChxA]MDL2189556.1 hypothetical protein [Pseudomonas sp. ChxA]OOW06978.1 hypothetical protein MF6394_01615 [Pseudomonas sp. MF6394]
MTERSTPKTAEMMQQVLAKGWAPDENLPAENLEFVPVWIYSYGYEAGCRLHGQMLKAIYENGLPQDFLSSLTLNAGDEYANKLAIFDTRSSGATEEDKQNLLAHMFNFTRGTRLWGTLPSYTMVPGVHVVVVDWNTRSNGHVLVQAGAIQAELMTPHQVTNAAQLAMEAHLARHPSDRPRSRAHAH